MTTQRQDSSRLEREAGLRYGDVARIAEQGALRGLGFVDAHTVEPYSDYWVLRLSAADGTLYRVDSWARWQALLDAPEDRPRTAGRR